MGDIVHDPVGIFGIGKVIVDDWFDAGLMDDGWCEIGSG